MARAYASTIIEAPVEAVWPVVRDFNGLPNWTGVIHSEIEGGLPADAVGCVRSFVLADGSRVKETLLSLDDSRYTFSYDFLLPAFPVANYIATLRLIPLTSRDATFAEWSAEFDEAPGDTGKYVAVISRDVFGGGLASLAAKLAGAPAPVAARRWDGWRPSKVFVASVIRGPADAVWRKVRPFSGMGGWHPDVAGMHMTAAGRDDQVGGVRDFTIGGKRVVERLTYLSDPDRIYRYTIEQSSNPWLDYHAGPRFLPITSTHHTLGIWMADWTASANDDARLIPDIHRDVFQKAFDTLDAQFAPP